MHMHTIGAAEEITLVELEADPQEESQEVQHQEIAGEGEPEVDHLPECPNHQPTTFVKRQAVTPLVLVLPNCTCIS